jgi:hypothetical protein
MPRTAAAGVALAAAFLGDRQANSREERVLARIGQDWVGQASHWR